ncbi:MAG: helix-turn-helix transcriptional regulator [Bacteroidia bacterium]
MSKRGYISRYLLILKKLKAKPYASFDEIDTYLHNQFEYLQMQDDNLQIGFSKRTFQRDIKEIRNIFGIDIEYSKLNKGYFISNTDAENMSFQRRMEAFDMFTSLNLAEDLSAYVQLEKRRPQGTEHLFGLLYAIKNRFQVKFSYQKFWDDEFTIRTTEPYALKEFKNRWYIIAKDLKDQIIKTFALDRITNVEITTQQFAYPYKNNLEEIYTFCFGIISPTNEKPMDIILSFEPIQGKYIKTLPLHHTQQIITDNDKELRIKLKLYITHDFVMELLSFGENVTVVEPKILVQTIKQAHQNAYKKYL